MTGFQRMGRRPDFRIITNTWDFPAPLLTPVARRIRWRDRLLGFAFGALATLVCVLAGWLIAGLA